MSEDFGSITKAYWHLVEKIKDTGIKNFTSAYPAMTLNFQQFQLTDPRKNWLEATGFKYSIFWTLREFSDRITSDPRTQNPGYAIRFDQARWRSRIEGPKAKEKMLALQKSNKKQPIFPDDYREGKFAYTYGERWHDKDQLDFINLKLSAPMRWNHVYLSVWNYHEDNHRFGRRVPCTVGIQFIPNRFEEDGSPGKIKFLDCQAMMRNNMLNSFFISDIFCFTTLFQWMAAKHKFTLGRYSHSMGKVYYRYKVMQQLRVVNSLNDYREKPFDVYDHYPVMTFGDPKFETEWAIKEVLEAKWRSGDFERIIKDTKTISDPYIRNWARVMAIGELSLIKHNHHPAKMIQLLGKITNEWQFPCVRETILYIQRTIKKQDEKRELIKACFETLPSKDLWQEIAKEVIFRSKVLGDLMEELAPGSAKRYFNVYRNLDIDYKEFRGDKRAIQIHQEILETGKTKGFSPPDDE